MKLVSPKPSAKLASIEFGVTRAFGETVNEVAAVIDQEGRVDVQVIGVGGVVAAIKPAGVDDAAFEKDLNGRETEPWEILCFKFYKSQIPVIEQAIETATLMLGSDKSRGYCLETICADFLAGAHMDNGNPEILLNSISRYYKFLPAPQKQAFFQQVAGIAS